MKVTMPILRKCLSLRQCLPLALVIGLGPLLAACESTGGGSAMRADGAITASTGGTEAATERRNTEELRLGKEHFRNGNFGIAEQHFRRAVEQTPESVEALVGLAASYDQLSRFDLADRAYVEALKVSGPNASIINNQGYSYYLRRDFKRARTEYSKALRLDPTNEQVKRNMALLEKRG
jgi:Flp pilus assembly protein TadD